MKIPSSKETAPVTAARSAGDRDARLALRDRISVADPERLAKVALVAREAVSAQRVAVLAELQAAVKSGTYKLDPQRIAKEMLRSSEAMNALQARAD